MVGPFDPDHDRDAEFFALPVEHVVLQWSEERFHRRVVTTRADTAHRAGQAVALEGGHESRRAELTSRCSPRPELAVGRGLCCESGEVRSRGIDAVID